MKRSIFIIYLITLSALTAFGQSGRGVLSFDKTVHDFGQVLISDGAVSCTFTATNTGNTDMMIESVSTSCGCTDVKWDHKVIKPGQSAKISATYSNEDGPYPFDKTLNVKISGQTRPVILHLRGIAQESLRPDNEIYTNVFGGVIGLEKSEYKGGNLEQGNSGTVQFTVANLGKSEAKISFADMSRGLGASVSPNPVPAGGHATVTCTISTQKDLWGYNDYSAVPVINGKNSGKSFTVRAFTAESFTELSKEEKNLGSRPVFEESTWSFGHKKAGSRFTASFVCKNNGKKDLIVHKADVDFAGAVPGAFPVINAGKSGKFNVEIDTAGMPKGEALIMITLTTNSPLRPIVTLFVAGIID